MAEIMTNAALTQILDNIYTSINNDNEGLDAHIVALKGALAGQGMEYVEIDTSKLPQANRQGRTFMQSYFKSRGVLVTFSAKA